jgi:RNA polymerase sigma factor (TIGR02999 family)
MEKPAITSEIQSQDSSQEEAAGPITSEQVALDQVFERLYKRIRQVAARIRWEHKNPTLNPTALVHEAYVKLRNDPPDITTRSYAEAIAVFSNAMHQILIDAARRKAAKKRIAVDLPGPNDLPIEDALTISNALDELERHSPRQAQIVRCRFLLGMTTEECAAALQLAKRTVERDWQSAKEDLSCRINPPRE